jgi:nucleoid-associated protein YgaU
MWNIAKAYYGDGRLGRPLAEMNGLNPDVIHPGDRVCLYPASELRDPCV